MSELVQVCPRCGGEYPEGQERCPRDGASLCDPLDLERIGTSFGSFEITDLIGVGGMGVVYEGRHTTLDKAVAIKVLNEQHGRRRHAADEMLREARAASRVQTPHIVDVTDFGTLPDGEPYLVMELLHGESLATVLQRDVRVPIPMAVEVVNQVASALAAAHDKGIVHRDLKPENVFLVDLDGPRESSSPGRRSQRNAGIFVKLLDFGLAKVLDMGPSSRTRAGVIAGTPFYMSPEQALNEEVDGRSDIYALGVLFYHMVSGHVPFTADSTLNILMAHVNEPVRHPGSHGTPVDDGTCRVILKCLEKDPERRYQTMDELRDALDRCGMDDSQLPDPQRFDDLTPPPPRGSGPTVTRDIAPRILAGPGPDAPARSRPAPREPPAPAPEPDELALEPPAPADGGPIQPTVTSEVVARILGGEERGDAGDAPTGAPPTAPSAPEPALSLIHI